MSLSSHAEFSKPSLQKPEAEKQDTPPLSTDKERNILSDQKTSKIFLVHVAQLHSTIPIVHNREGIREVPLQYGQIIFHTNFSARSQFNIAKTILANPDAIVLDESLFNDYNNDSGSENINQKIIERIKSIFPKGIPNTYNELTQLQKNCLSYEGAACVLFSLGLIQSIYKTHTKEDAIQGMPAIKKFYDKIDNSFSFSNPLTSDPELKELTCGKREKRALELIKEAVKKSGKINPVVLLIYGGCHKFTEQIKIMESLGIIYEGRINTSPKLDNPINEKILPCGKLIVPAKQKISFDTFENILSQYRIKYSSTSIFKEGYRSDAMKALVALLKKMETLSLRTISYTAILEELLQVDKNRAKLFREGLSSSNMRLKSATDKIILDLRRAYDGELLTLDHFSAPTSFGKNK